MLARLLLIHCLFVFSACGSDGSADPDTDSGSDEALDLDEAVLEVREWEIVDIDSELWVNYQNDGSWTASWSGSSANVHPIADTDGCYDYGAGTVGDVVALPRDVTLTVGGQSVILEPVPGAGGFASTHLRAAAGSGAAAAGRVAVDLPGGADILGLPAPAVDAEYTIVDEDAAPGAPWAVVTWTPTPDTDVMEIYLTNQLGRGTILCRVDNDGYAVLPYPPEGATAPLPILVTPEAVVRVELDGLVTLVRASPLGVSARATE